MNGALEELIQKSGDAILMMYEYQAGTLTAALRTTDPEDEIVTLQVHTDLLRVSLPSNPALPDRTCYLDLVDLTSRLNQNQHGIYVPPSDFAGLMKHVQEGVSLAYGRRAQDCGWALRFVGSAPLIVCLVCRLGDVSWSVNRKADEWGR
jgi:hypothetical protein